MRFSFISQIDVIQAVVTSQIVIFDKAYVDFAHIADLSKREVFWVTAPRTTCNIGWSENFSVGRTAICSAMNLLA